MAEPLPARAARMAEVSLALRRIWGPRELGRMLGVSPARAQRICNPDDTGSNLGLHELLGLPEAARLRLLGELGLLDVGEGGCVDQALLEAQRETHEALEAATRARLSGQWTADDLREIREGEVALKRLAKCAPVQRRQLTLRAVGEE